MVFLFVFSTSDRVDVGPLASRCPARGAANCFLFSVAFMAQAVFGGCAYNVPGRSPPTVLLL